MYENKWGSKAKQPPKELTEVFFPTTLWLILKTSMHLLRIFNLPSFCLRYIFILQYCFSSISSIGRSSSLLCFWMGVNNRCKNIKMWPLDEMCANWTKMFQVKLLSLAFLAWWQGVLWPCLVSGSRLVHYINWNSTNPLFRTSDDGHAIYVKANELGVNSYEQANIICPLYHRWVIVSQNENMCLKKIVRF